MEKLALAGIDQRVVAEILDINKSTLIKYFKSELQNSKALRLGNVAGALYNNAITGNVTAQIFYMKTQGGWRETQGIELSGSVDLVSVVNVIRKERV